MAEIASAHVSIYPKFADGFGSGVKREMTSAGTQGGTAYTAGFGKTATSGFKTVSAGIKAGLVGLVAGFTVAPIVDGFKSATGAASDLSETINKSKVIFGDNYAAMDAWASGAATSLGLSKQAALESASSFGNMFTQLGFTGDAAANMSQQVMQMATDMGSFNNLPTAEVADMISAAFRGEYDSLQRLVPTINAAAVETKALEMTGKSSAKQLTAQEKAAATLALVTEGAAVAMGDFANTSEGVANKSKINAARVEELKASFGGLLGPIQQVASDGFEKLIAVGEDFTAWLAKNPEVVEGFAAALSLAGDALGVLGTIVGAVVVPAMAILIEGFAQALDGVAAFLEALGTVPGFEWAADAAAKVSKIADGAHATAAGFEDLAATMLGAGAASEETVQAIWADVATLAQQINTTDATLTINGNPMPADQIAQTVIDNIDASTGTVTINGQSVPAEDALAWVIGLVDAGIGTITIGGDPEPANAATASAVATANGSTGTIGVDANTASAESDINYAARARTAVINVSVTGTADAFRLLRSANGGLVPSFAPGFAAGGRVTGWSAHDKADNVPAWLTAGEFVQPVSSVQHYGWAAMEAVRRREAVIAYGNGGSVGGSGSSAGGEGLAEALARALSGAELRLTGAVDTIGDAVAGRILLAYEGAV